MPGSRLIYCQDTNTGLWNFMAFNDDPSTPYKLTPVHFNFEHIVDDNNLNMQFFIQSGYAWDSILFRRIIVVDHRTTRPITSLGLLTSNISNYCEIGAVTNFLGLEPYSTTFICREFEPSVTLNLSSAAYNTQDHRSAFYAMFALCSQYNIQDKQALLYKQWFEQMMAPQVVNHYVYFVPQPQPTAPRNSFMPHRPRHYHVRNKPPIAALQNGNTAVTHVPLPDTPVQTTNITEEDVKDDANAQNDMLPLLKAEPNDDFILPKNIIKSRTLTFTVTSSTSYTATNAFQSLDSTSDDEDDPSDNQDSMGLLVPKDITTTNKKPSRNTTLPKGVTIRRQSTKADDDFLDKEWRKALKTNKKSSDKPTQLPIAIQQPAPKVVEPTPQLATTPSHKKKLLTLIGPLIMILWQIDLSARYFAKAIKRDDPNTNLEEFAKSKHAFFIEQGLIALISLLMALHKVQQINSRRGALILHTYDLALDNKPAVNNEIPSSTTTLGKKSSFSKANKQG